MKKKMFDEKSQRQLLNYNLQNETCIIFLAFLQCKLEKDVIYAVLMLILMDGIFATKKEFQNDQFTYCCRGFELFATF